MPGFSDEHKMEAAQMFVCICSWALLGAFHKPEELVPTSFTFWLCVADSAHTMKQLLPNQCNVIFCSTWLCSPSTPVRWGRGVARSNCPRTGASCRLATSMGNPSRTGAMGSPSGTDSWRTHLGRSDFSLRVCRSYVNEGTCWALWAQGLPWRLQGSHSSSQELIVLKDCSINKKKGKKYIFEGTLKKNVQSEDCCFTSNKELFLQDSQKESNLACFMASVAPSSPTLVVGAVWKTTILGKPALIITMSQAHNLTYIWHKLEVKIVVRISFSGTTQSLFVAETALQELKWTCRGTSSQNSAIGVRCTWGTALCNYEHIHACV